jgi:hypothetical protein
MNYKRGCSAKRVCSAPVRALVRIALWDVRLGDTHILAVVRGARFKEEYVL